MKIIATILAMGCFLIGCDSASDEHMAVSAAVPLSATYAEASAALVEIGYTCVTTSGQYDLPNGESRSASTFLDCFKNDDQRAMGCPVHWRVILVPEYERVREFSFFEHHRCF